ncbi:MAG: PilZ domain-containing protein [Thermoanaerobaculia bacterium]
MESDDNVSGEFQRSTRMPLDAVVRLHFQGTVAYQNGFAANVSATGMFVKHPAPPPLGTQLVFEFNLGVERKPVQGAGEVVWVRDKYLGPGQPAGVGIRFLQLDSQSRDHIAEALFEFLEQSLAEDSLLDSTGYAFGTDSAKAPSAPLAVDFFPATPAPPLNPTPTGNLELEALGDIYGEPDRAAEAALGGEPFDFAALERLPKPLQLQQAPAQSGPSADGRRAFSVFTSLDEADPQTADIVREALREEAPLPMMAAAAAASSEREGSSVWRVVLLLAVVAGAGYLAWTLWGSAWLARRSTATPPAAVAAEAAPPAARKPEPLNAEPEPGTTLAESVGVDPTSTSPAAAPPHSAPATAPPEEPSDVSAAGQESSEDAVAEGAAPSLDAAGPATNLPRPPAAAVAAVAPTPAPNPAPAPGPAAAARAGRLTGIEWRESGETAGETVLVLTGDGIFVTGSFSYSEIGGDNPRVLIKLKGMESPYRGAAPRAPQVGGALVRGVRTGFHVTANGNEVHVVVDLARRGIKVVTLAPENAGLSLRLAP